MAKNIVVTGGNIGIGFQTVKGLYSDGHNVIFGSRNQQRNLSAVNEVKAAYPNSTGQIKSFQLDLSKRSSIEEFAKQVKAQFDRIDILINNAGITMNDRQLNESGVQMTMVVNHFGHFLLTYLLFPLISKAKKGRIINVSSQLHNKTKLIPSQDLAGEENWSSLGSYNKSKLANVQFTVGLADKLSKHPNIKTMSLHPGLVDSNFFTETSCCSIFRMMKICCFCCFVSTETGARTSLHLSRIPFNELKNGEYYDSDTTIIPMNELGRNKKYVDDLWRVSQQLYKIQFKI